MDFPQQPQGTTPPMPMPGATPIPSSPPPFPNVPSIASTPPAAGPLPGSTLPPLGTSFGNSTPPSVQIPIQSHPSPLSTSDEQVYTMPEKFLAGTAPTTIRPKKANKAVTIVLIVVIALLVIGAVGGVLYYFLVLANQDTTEIDAQNAVVVNNANTVVNTNTASSNTNAVNVNENANTNATVVNDNTNTANTNAVNANANSNANTNTNANANTNTNPSTVPPASKDTDADSLTNDEEQIWSTKADLPDTDSDGYQDGTEILAGYDPTTATGRLSTSPLVGTFANSEYGYTMLYPANWLAEALSEGNSTEVLFTPNTLALAGQFVAVTVTGNPTGLTALDWYVETTNVEEADVEPVVAFAGANGVWSIDGMTAYYADTNYVYALSYRYGNSDELYFPSTFEVMLKSFALSATAN